MEKSNLFKGLDVRSNQLLRAGNTARDCSNVRLDGNNKLIKREEFTALTAGIPAGETVIDIVKYDNDTLCVFVVVDTDSSTADYNKLYTYTISSGTLTEIRNNNMNVVNDGSFGYIAEELRTFNSKVTHFFKNNVLYWIGSSRTDTTPNSGLPIMMKFDGDTWSAAGVDYPFDDINVEDQGVLGSDFYIRKVPFTVDAQGNHIFGQWIVDRVTPSGSIVFVNDIGYTDVTEFGSYSNASFRLDGDQTISESDLVVSARDINCIEGQYVILTDLGSSPFNFVLTNLLYRFKIDSIAGTDITLSEPQIYNGSTWESISTFSITLSDYYPIGNMMLAVYYSDTYDIGYVFGDISSIAEFNSDTHADDISFDTTGGAAGSNVFASPILLTTNFEDFYGTEIKGNPPEGLQIVEYGDACILIDENTLYFSDLSINGTVENFTAFDNFEVGERERGLVTGLFANEIFIMVSREEECYLVVGNIFTGNFRIQTYRSTRVGGRSPASFVEIAGQCLFMSNRGPDMALENGSLRDLGDRIEPIFVDDIFSYGLDLSLADTIIDFKKEIAYMFVQGSTTDVVFLYDYRNNEWFKYNNFNCRGGMAIVNDKLYYSDGSDIYEEEASHTYTSGVEAFWDSNFDIVGNASLKKRFQRVALFLTEQVTGTINLKSYKDWETATAITDEDITPTASEPIDMKRLNPSRAYSNSIRVFSSGTDVMKIDGFLYQLEEEQAELNDVNR